MIAKKSAALLLITLLTTSSQNHCWHEPEWVTRLVDDLDAWEHTGRAMLKLHNKLSRIDRAFLATNYRGYSEEGIFVDRANIRMDNGVFTTSGLANKLSKQHKDATSWQEIIKHRDEQRAQAVQPYCKELLVSPLFSAIMNSHHGIDVLTQCKAVGDETKKDNAEVNA
jgi:hypothetical protein